MSCSSLALAAGEPLAGTASVATRWLLVEVAGPWGRDVVDDTELDGAVRRRLREWLGERDGSRVLFLRQPASRGETITVFSARSDEDGGRLRRLILPSLSELAETDLAAGDDVGGALLLVCGHGRRDPCCARHGGPVFEALGRHVENELLWQSSHQGGHRFAANVLALPAGVALGRVPPHAAGSVAAALGGGRIPLDYFRGRTIYAPEVQAAEAAVRERLALTGLGDVRLRRASPGRVVLETPSGTVEVEVEVRDGPLRPESCGAAPVPARIYDVHW